MGKLDGRVAIVTGAGSGLGRCHALLLAEEGARVVVNDLGESAQAVADEITSAGGEAVADQASVAEWETGQALVGTAVDTFGDLHIVVNNAGILRDKMSFSMNEDEWDAVIAVHLKGHFVTSRAAAIYWREQSKAGNDAPRRLVHTSSESGIFGAAGQTNYGAAKGGILTMSLAFARELEKYGATSNVIAPRARTGLTDYIGAFAAPEDPAEFDRYDPANVSPLVVWLCTDDAADVNGQTFIVGGSGIFLMQRFSEVGDIRKDNEAWTVAEIQANRDALFGGRDTGIPGFDAPSF